MNEIAIYSCVDQEHNTWICRGCGYMENFEADGPAENGWRFCPGCGHEIEVEKDCKNWARHTGVVDSPNGHCFYLETCMNGNDFCSYAEARTNE